MSYWSVDITAGTGLEIKLTRSGNAPQAVSADVSYSYYTGVSSSCTNNVSKQEGTVNFSAQFNDLYKIVPYSGYFCSNLTKTCKIYYSGKLISNNCSGGYTTKE